MRALLVAETRIYREALRVVLGQSTTICVAEALTPDAALNAQRESADVILLHQRPPEGLVLARMLQSLRRPLVVFGVKDDDREVTAWAEAGVIGCVSENAPLGELLSAAEMAIRGLPSCSPILAGLLFRHVAATVATRSQRRPTTAAGLTTRENEVLLLMAEGLSNKQIAMSLSVQLSTVKNHVHSILVKLGARRRTDAIAWASSAAL